MVPILQRQAIRKTKLNASRTNDVEESLRQGSPTPIKSLEQSSLE